MTATKNTSASKIEVLRIGCSEKSQFTILAFGAANGQHILCAIMFAAKTMLDTWVIGFDPFIEWIRHESNLDGNTEESRQYTILPE